MLISTMKRGIQASLCLVLMLSLTLTAFAQPANDNVANAQAVVVDDIPFLASPLNGATAEAGEDVLTPPNSAGCDPHTWCDVDGITASHWYTFDAPASGAVRVDLCGSDFDSQLAVYSVGDPADFGTFSLIDASDDTAAPDGMDCGALNPDGAFASFLDLGCLTPGETYYVLVDLWTNGAADYTMTNFASVHITSLDAAAPLSITSVDPVAPGCEGLSDGSATVVFDGTFPWDIIWSNGQTSETATGLAAGSFGVTVSDFCGGVASSTVTVDDGPPPVALTILGDDEYAFHPTGCNDGSGDGQIIIAPTSGIAPHTYAWSNGATEPVLSNLSSGVYTVTVSDACGGDPLVQTFLVGQTAGADAEIDCSGESVVLGPAAPRGSDVDFVTYSTAADIGGSVTCGVNGPNFRFTTENSYWRAFDLDGDFGQTGMVQISAVEVAVLYTRVNPDENFATQPIEFALHTADNMDLAVATINEIERKTIQVPDMDSVLLRVPFDRMWDAADILVLEVRDPTDSEDGTGFLPGANTSVATQETTYLSAADCGIGSPTAIGNIGGGFANEVIMNVLVGQTPDFSYNWAPAAGLDATDIQNPTASAAGTYSVTITDNNCGTSIVDEVVVSCPTVSILDPVDHSFSIYPNPSHGMFNIQNDGAVRDMDIRVHNLQGKEIVNMTRTFGAGDLQSLDLTGMPAGVYLLQMTHEDLTEVHRLVIH
ncbi:MAG: T9SS type A sorting domain-containing protein [Bacteroidota bacterium]